MKLITSFLLVFLLVPSIVFSELVCPKPSGCPIDENGICLGCIQQEEKEPQKLTTPLPVEKEKKKSRVKERVVSSGGFIQEGQYQITKVVNNDGFSLVWDKGVILDISNVSGGVYVVRVMGVGSVRGEIVNCSKPVIFTMKLDSKGKVLTQNIVDEGSCSISSLTNDTWYNTTTGLKKVKRWTETIVDGEVRTDWVCVVGPCKDIIDKTYTFFYTRLL